MGINLSDARGTPQRGAADADGRDRRREGGQCPPLVADGADVDWWGGVNPACRNSDSSSAAK